MIDKIVWTLMLGLALVFGCARTAHAIDPIQFQSQAEETRFLALAKELRCLVCQNESLADSNAGLAQDLRQEIIGQIRGGKSDDEIKRYLTARYGDFILYKPPMKPATWLLWLGPFAFLTIGALVAIAIMRRRKSNTTASSTQDPLTGDW